MVTVCAGVVMLVVVTVVSGVAVESRGSGLADCLESDSLECVRETIARNLRAVFGQRDSAVRKVRAAEVPMSSKDPAQRQELVKQEGSNITSETASEEVAEDGGIVEGRGKKLKKILPFLLALKMQYFVYGVLAYIVVALVAKAALLKGSLALALAGVFLLKKLLSSHHVVARTEVKYHQHSHTKTYGGSAADYGAAGYGGGASYGGGGASYGGGGASYGGGGASYGGGGASYGGGGASYGGGGASYGGASYGDGQSGGGWDSYGAPVDQNKQYAHNSGHSVVYRGQKPAGR